MKVTVCFGDICILIPCDNGRISIKQLTEEAIFRYRKLTGKPANCQINVYSLRDRNGAILDPDDQLHSVLEDKEQVVAIFEEYDANSCRQQNFDSADSSLDSLGRRNLNQKFSSSNNREPGRYNETNSVQNATLQIHDTDSNAVEITSLEAPSGLLVVKRGNEFNNSKRLKTSSDRSNDKPLESKAYFAERTTEPIPILGGYLRPKKDDTSNKCFIDDAVDRDEENISRFSRNPARKSRITDSWIEAAERAEERYWEKQDSIENNFKHADGEENIASSDKLIETVFLTIPYSSNLCVIGSEPRFGNDGRFMGLLVKFVENGCHLDGRIFANDVITEINSQPLVNFDYTSAQKLFNSTLASGPCTLQLIRYKRNNFKVSTHVNELIEKFNANVQSSYQNHMESVKFAKDSNNNAQSESMPDDTLTNDSINGSEPSTSAAYDISQSNIASMASAQSTMQKANTRRLGKKIIVVLKKGQDGLGFSVAERSSPASGETLMYIKNVLPRGAAINDGRLKAGDRLLEVNKIPVTGMSQSNVVQMLRALAEGSNVELLLSRQDTLSPLLPRHLPLEQANVELIEEVVRVEDEMADSGSGKRILTDSPNRRSRRREELVFDIPLNDTGCAGLGVAVKGRIKYANSHETTRDLGIFVKTILTGGAAYKDGRLHVNDQLIAVNNNSLNGLSNEKAMLALRATMQELDPNITIIRLTVLRVIGYTPPSKAVADNQKTRNTTVNEALASPSPSSDVANQSSETLISACSYDSGGELLLDIPGQQIKQSSRARHKLNLAVNSSGEPIPGKTIASSVVFSPTDHSQTLAINGLSHFSVPGYGEYAIVSKSLTVNVPRDEASRAVIMDDSQHLPKYPAVDLKADSSIYEDISAMSCPATDDDCYSDKFVRDAPGRQSMSEKRHGAARTDPSTTALFQKIKHSRQGSAPTLQSNVDDSLNAIAASQGNSKMNQPGMRKSWSLESLSQQGLPLREKDSKLIHEIAAVDGNLPMRNKHQFNSQRTGSTNPPLAAVLRKKVNRTRPTNDSFRAAVDKSYPDDDTGLDEQDDVEQNMVSQNMPSKHEQTNNNNNNNKQQQKERRLSSGSGLKQWFRGFSKSGGTTKKEDQLNEKAQENAYKIMVDEKKKVKEQYETVKYQQQKEAFLNFHHQQQQQQQQQMNNYLSARPPLNFAGVQHRPGLLSAVAVPHRPERFQNDRMAKSFGVPNAACSPRLAAREVQFAYCPQHVAQFNARLPAANAVAAPPVYHSHHNSYDYAAVAFPQSNGAMPSHSIASYPNPVFNGGRMSLGAGGSRSRRREAQKPATQDGNFANMVSSPSWAYLSLERCSSNQQQQSSSMVVSNSAGHLTVANIGGVRDSKKKKVAHQPTEMLPSPEFITFDASVMAVPAAEYPNFKMNNASGRFGNSEMLPSFQAHCGPVYEVIDTRYIDYEHLRLKKSAGQRKARPNSNFVDYRRMHSSRGSVPAAPAAARSPLVPLRQANLAAPPTQMQHCVARPVDMTPKQPSYPPPSSPSHSSSHPHHSMMRQQHSHTRVSNSKSDEPIATRSPASRFRLFQGGSLPRDKIKYITRF